MKPPTLHSILWAVFGVIFITITLWLATLNTVFANPYKQIYLTPTPFFRFPVVPNIEVSGLFDHNGAYPNDVSNQAVTFYNGRASMPPNGFQFTCPGVGDDWVGCEVAATSEADCPDDHELWYDKHHGIDYEYAIYWRTGDSCDLEKFAGLTHPVYAPANGKVALIQENHPFNGNAIFINHDLDGDGNYDNDNIRSTYLHFAELNPAITPISPNDSILIETGDYLGEGGMTGKAWTPHLHFEVQRWKDSLDAWVPIDPYGWQGTGEDPWPYQSYPLWRYDILMPLLLKNYSVCAENMTLIQNGDFESGPPARPWVQNSNVGNELVSTQLPYTGMWGVWLGGLPMRLKKLPSSL